MLKDVIPGTSWWDGKDKKFKVMGVFDKEDGSTWVYYREDKGMTVSMLECQNYTCLLEAFVQRFRETL